MTFRLSFEVLEIDCLICARASNVKIDNNFNKAAEVFQANEPSQPDQLIAYVYYRKAFRYWMNYLGNRTQYFKVDMAQAFHKWKNSYEKQKSNLDKLCKRELEERAIHDREKLEALGNIMAKRENRNYHLKNLRDTLVDNMVKGQKIALALWSWRYEFTKE